MHSLLSAFAEQKKYTIFLLLFLRESINQILAYKDFMFVCVCVCVCMCVCVLCFYFNLKKTPCGFILILFRMFLSIIRSEGIIKKGNCSQAALTYIFCQRHFNLKHWFGRSVTIFAIFYEFLEYLEKIKPYVLRKKTYYIIIWVMGCLIKRVG